MGWLVFTLSGSFVMVFEQNTGGETGFRLMNVIILGVFLVFLFCFLAPSL